MRKAAARLGIHEITIRKHIAVLRETYGVATNAQLADVLARSQGVSSGTIDAS